MVAMEVAAMEEEAAAARRLAEDPRRVARLVVRDESHVADACAGRWCM